MHERERWALRRALARHARGREFRYAKELKARVVAHAEQRRRAGATWAALSSELGLHLATLRRWCGSRSAPRAIALRPVEVVADSASRSVTVVSPSGFRVEGLVLESAVAMLRALG